MTIPPDAITKANIAIEILKLDTIDNEALIEAAEGYLVFFLKEIPMQMNQINMNVGAVNNTIIPPVVGRMVWYYTNKDQTEPYAAQIARVNGDGTINVGYLDTVGRPGNSQLVLLIQPGEELPKTGDFCTWMPYQIGQATKTQTTQDELDKIKKDYLTRAADNAKG